MQLLSVAGKKNSECVSYHTRFVFSYPLTLSNQNVPKPQGNSEGSLYEDERMAFKKIGILCN
jgi:hypothetical protein